MNFSEELITKLSQSIQAGELVYSPTDTIPGLICSALNQQAVNKIYVLKKRNLQKPPTFIISSLNQLHDLEVNIAGHESICAKYWPGSVSIVLPIKEPSTNQYLHRSKNSLAIRLTANEGLRQLVDLTGPLATSSTNYEGSAAADCAATARAYFGESIDLYVDHKPQTGDPSRILKLRSDGSTEVIRQAAD